MGGYALAPGAFDAHTFIMCSLGTALVSATANSINQYFEVPFDAQMSRTKNRVLVRGHFTPGQAIIFATIAGVSGLSLLYYQVNGLTAALGAANLILYTSIYTPLKRVSIVNTWIGSVGKRTNILIVVNSLQYNLFGVYSWSNTTVNGLGWLFWQSYCARCMDNVGNTLRLAVSTLQCTVVEFKT